MRKMLIMQKSGETFPDGCKGLEVEVSLVGFMEPTESQRYWSVVSKESGGNDSMGETGEMGGARPQRAGQEVHGCLSSKVSFLFRVQV